MARHPLRRRRIKQPHEVLRANGQRINWLNPPKPNAMCRWSKHDMYGRTIRGSFRTLCHLNRLNNLSIARFGVGIVIIQPDWNTTVAASAGTHDKDSVWDVWIPGVDPWVQQRFFRANGFGCWYRYPPMFSQHQHGFTVPVPSGSNREDDFADRGFPVGVWVPGQLEDYWHSAFGLSGAHTPGSDRSWRPSNVTATVFRLDKYVERRARLARR